MFKLDCSRNSFEVLHVPGTALLVREKNPVSAVTAGLLHESGCGPVKGYLSITSHPSQGRLLGLCSVMSVAYLEGS